MDIASARKALIPIIIVATLLSFSSFGAASDKDELVSDKQIVDCLLQGQIRKLGNSVYQAPPRPVRIPAVDCEIRGGDFMVYDRASFASSLSHWLELAKGGDVNAQIYVGEIFERGLGQDAPDYAQAAAWYQRAAESGNPVAQINLAQMYEKGLGVEVNAVEATRLYASAFGPAGANNAGMDPGSLNEPGEEIRQLEAQLANTQQEARDLAVQLNATQNNLSRAQADLDDRQNEEQKLSAELELAQRRLADASGNDDAVQVAQVEVRRSEEQLSTQQAYIARLLEEVARNEAQVSAYQGQMDRVTELESELEQQTQKYNSVNQELRQTRLALADSNRQLSEQQQKLDYERLDLQRTRVDLSSQTSESADARQQLEAELQSRETRLSAQASQLEELQSEIQRREDYSRDLQNKLTELNQQNQELVAARAEAERYRKETERLKMMLADTEIQRGKVEAESANAREVEALQVELNRLSGEADRYQTRISELESTQMKVAAVDLAGPSIQLIDPSAFNTRGVQEVEVESDLPTRQLVGKVTAPAGLLSLTVNEIPTDINERNVFKADVELSGPATTVTVVAIDNQAKRAERIINLVREMQQQEPAPKATDVDFGQYHALLIGNEDYAFLPDLETPKEDIDAIGAILKEKYGFKVTYVRDGTRQTIMDSMYELLGELTSEDNLLIYYAGHGEYVADTNRGVWLPTNAKTDSPANWISNVEINDYLKQIRAKQIIVVADSCYSGALTRSALINVRPGLTDKEYEAHLEKMSKTIARVVLTSGGLAPVLDSAGPDSEHSIFAAAFIDILSSNNAVLSGQDLGKTIAAKVSLAAQNVGYDQEPQYAPLNHSSHQGGDFFFVPGFL